jgi:predicted kinase
VRRALFPEPRYTDGENGFVYLTCYELLGQLLRDGHVAVFDATNLQRSGRNKARKLAASAGAPTLMMVTTAPPEVVAERLRQRAAGGAEAYSSDADWEVHQKLAATMEAMEGTSLEIDTSRDLADALDAVGRFLRDRGPGGGERPLAAEEVTR